MVQAFTEVQRPRCKMVPAGGEYAALTYNVFALSTLMFIGQLEQIPTHACDIERSSICKMFPGPGKWITPEDLWYLSENFGFCKSPQPSQLMVRAAQFRVAALGCHFRCKKVCPKSLRRRDDDNIHDRWAALQSCMRSTDHMDRLAAWSGWYTSNFCKTLVENVNYLSSIGITQSGMFQAITGQSPLHWDGNSVRKIQKQLQRLTLKALKKRFAPVAPERIRHNLCRWHDKPFGVSGVPGKCSRSISRRLQKLSELVTPRVHAAVFKTMWNGWNTHRRWQRRHWTTNICMFKCCSTAEDSIEHYCRCPVVLRVASRVLRFEYPLEFALNMWVLNSSWLDDPTHLISISLLIYGAYMGFNSISHGRINGPEEAYDLIVQHCKQGTFGHPPTMKHLDGSWARSITYVC